MESFLTRRSSMYLLGRVEGKPEQSGAWFFYDDYGPHVLSGESLIKYLIVLDLHHSTLSRLDHALNRQDHDRFVLVLSSSLPSILR